MRNHQYIPIDLYLKLFNAMLEAILLYESEIWGYENIKVLLLYININPSPSHQGAHLFLYIGLIIPIVQPSIIPVSMTRLKIFLEP
jgi:hypothetical protein